MTDSQNAPLDAVSDRHVSDKPTLDMDTLFVTLTLPIPEHSGQLRSQVESALRSHGHPLRWAITRIDQQNAFPAIAHVEAIVTQPR